MCKRRGILIDMEDLTPCKALNNSTARDTNDTPFTVMPVIQKGLPGPRRGKGVMWFQPSSLNELLETLLFLTPFHPIICAGCTAGGIYHDLQLHKVYVNTSAVSEFQQYSVDRNGIQFGAAITLVECIHILQRHPEQVYLFIFDVIT